MRSVLSALAALLLLPLALALSATGPRVLVVLDEPAHEARFSRLFGALRQELGLDVVVRGARDDKPRLTEFRQRSFDHLLLLAPAAKALSADLSPQELVSFLKNGGNVLFGLAPSFAEAYRDLAREFALEMEPRSSLVVDHFRALAGSSDSASNDSSILLGPAAQNGGIVPNAHVFSAEALQAAQQYPLLFSGVAHRVGPNPMAFPLIRAPSSSYSKTGMRAEGDETAAAPLTGADADAALVSGFQLKDNSARAIWSGSIDMFADESLQEQQRRTRDGESYTSTANLPVSLAIISWLTQSHGVLRVAQTSHERVRAGPHDERPDYEEWVDEAGGAVQRMYRVKDHVTFNLDLSRHDPVQGWVPAPRDLDLQVSLVMLDPFITAPLVALDAAPSSSSGALDGAQRSSAAHTRYSSTFQLPDRHGVYTFSVEWARHGWSYVSTRDVAPVRPFNHDEHPRGLSAAWPYVGGAFSTMLAFAVFVVLWTLTTEKSRPRAGKEE